MRPHFPTPSWSNRVRAISEGSLPSESNIPPWLAERLGRSLSCLPDGRPETETQTSLPAVFSPENYEPNYPYPLIVWLSDPAHSTDELLHLTSQLSPQNYLGTAVHGCGVLEGLFYSMTGVLRFPVEELAERVHGQVRRIRRAYHIHSERVYLAGCDLAATLALELLLHQPDWFGGLLGFGLVRVPEGRSLRHYHRLRGKRVFLATDLRSPRRSLQVFLKTSRLLHSGGLDVTARLYEADRPITPEMLADANQWLIDAIRAADAV